MRSCVLLGVLAWLPTGCWADFPGYLLNPDQGGERDADAGRADAPKDTTREAGRDQTAVDVNVIPDSKAGPPTKNNGDTCTTPGQCFSGMCSADGYCCNTPCPEPCRECTTGGCVPIVAGKPPKSGTCPTGGTCGADGKCDGLGACRTNTPAGTVCGNPSCSSTGSGNQITLGKLCDSSGNCQSAGSATISCGKYRCSTTSGLCRWPCGDSPDCISGESCNNSECGGDHRPLGTTCSTNGECENGFCKDGVCCDVDCKEPCRMCNHAAAKGHCIYVPAGMPPPSGTTPAKSCPLDTNKPCEGDGTCKGDGSCQDKTPAGKLCKVACAAGDVLQFSYCDGNNVCAPSAAAKYPCGKYKCQTGASPASCFGRCAGSTACRTGCTCNPFTAQCEGSC